MKVSDYKIILGSKSPRRKEILKNAGYDYEVIVSEDEYNIIGQKYDDELIYKCIDKKYNGIERKLILNDTDKLIVICADTVVVLDDMIIGKPKDKEDAIKILSNLSDKTHVVATGLQLVFIDNGEKVSIKKAIEKTKVTFRKLSQKDIIDYIDRCAPFDKAGAYGIQDESFDFVSNIDGNMDNVIGFPMNIFLSLIK